MAPSAEKIEKITKRKLEPRDILFARKTFVSAGGIKRGGEYEVVDPGSDREGRIGKMVVRRLLPRGPGREREGFRSANYWTDEVIRAEDRTDL